jgi:hypothetical protein
LDFAIIILLLIILLNMRISFMLLISVDNSGFNMEVKVMFLKLLTLYKWDFREGGLSFLFKKKKDVPKDLKKKKGRLSGSLKMLFSKDTFRHLKKNMEVFNLSIKGTLATMDAAETALLYGGIWSILGNLIPHIPQKRLFLDFYPDFKRETPDFHITCILRVRLIHIIVVIINSGKRK